MLLFTGHVGLLFSKTWMDFGLRVSVSSLLTMPLKSTVKLIDTHAMSLENAETVSLETCPASAQTQINCRWCGVSLRHVACAGLTTGGTMIL